LAVFFFCWLTTWCVTASLEEVGATTTAPSRHEKTLETKAAVSLSPIMA
jgi:hypothetical protein